MNNEKLQELCRSYLARLRYLAKKHGLSTFIDETIRANKRGECSGTLHEIEMLARMCDEERVSRVDVPKILEKSYRQCFEDEDFDKIKKLHRVGIYSRISALLYADRIKKRKSKKL